MAQRKRRRKGRRLNGEGSRGTTSGGRAYVAIRLPDGKRKWFYGKDAAEAEGHFQAYMDALTDDLDTVTAETPLADYLDAWIDIWVRRHRRDNTRRIYAGMVRNHIRPHRIGRISLARLKRRDVQAWVDDLLDTAMAKTTVRRLYTQLHSGLRHAVVRANVLPRNPADGIDPILTDDDIEEVRPLSASDARKLLDATRGTIVEAMYALELSFGLRQGEILALRWQDIDLSLRILQVRYQIQHGKLSPLKRTWHRRSLGLSAEHVALLEVHAQRLADERKAAGDRWREYDLVFPTSRGTPLYGSWHWHQFKALLKQAKMEDTKFHNLRHTAASLMLQAGVPLYQVSKILGHKSIVTTANLYAHLVPEGREGAANTMSAVLGMRSRSEKVAALVVDGAPALPPAPRNKIRRAVSSV